MTTPIGLRTESARNRDGLRKPRARARSTPRHSTLRQRQNASLRFGSVVTSKSKSLRNVTRERATFGLGDQR